MAYFVLHQNNWWLVNENLPDLYDLQNKKNIPIGEKIKLENNGQILLKKGQGGRLIQIQMAGE